MNQITTLDREAGSLEPLLCCAPVQPDTTPSAEIIAQRRAAHEHELVAHRRWSRAVRITSLGLAAYYLVLLMIVRVMEPFYLIVNVLAIITGLCGIFVFRVYQLPTILAELPQLSERDRAINLAAIEPTRAELLADVLPNLGLVRRREEAAALDDDELVRRLSGVRRPDWRKRARVAFIAWLIVIPATLVWVAIHRPEHGLSLIDRLD